jgi:hypothetical protein
MAASMQTNMASGSRWALRSRSLTAIGIAVALVAGAVAERTAPAQALQPPSGPPPTLPPTGSPDSLPPQPDPKTGIVPQRSDRETPRSYYRLPTQPPATTQKRPGTMVEAASAGVSSSNRVQVEQRAQPQRPASPSQVEQLVQRSQSSIDFFELVDDILDEIARQLAREDPNLMSPMSIRLVRLSANLRPEFARTLETRLIARLVNSTNVKVTVCAECTSLRSRVEDGNWMVTMGAVKQEDLRRIGQTTGIKTFMDVDFTYAPNSNVVWMQAVAFRASDGGVVWSDAYRSDATMAALLRTGRRIPTRAERAAELEQKINARPNYGYAASLGVAQVGYNAPTGSIAGAQVSLRFHEKFGEDLGSLFGLSAGIFTTGPPSMSKVPSALNSIMLGAYFSHNLSPPNLNRAEVWFYTEGGGMFSGNEGNTFYVEGGLDTHLKWRLSLQGGLMYVFPTKFSNYDLGGVGFRLRAAMNW